MDPFLSPMERPPVDSAQRASNRSRRIPSKRPLRHRRRSGRPSMAPVALPPMQSRVGDDAFILRNNNARNNAPSGVSDDIDVDFVVDDDVDDDDDASLLLPRLVYPRAPTTQEILARHTRLTTVYDPLHPPPDDEQTREGTALGLRPDYEGRLFHHQTMRLGRWCAMTGHHVERDELMDAEKEMLDWKFERPAAPRRRVPSKQGVGRACMGAYLRRRRDRIPRYQVTRRRRMTAARSGSAPDAAASAPAVAPAPVPPPSLFPRGGGATASSQGTNRNKTPVNPDALAEAFYEWRAKKAKGQPTGTPQEWLAAFAKRNSSGHTTAPTEAATVSPMPLATPSTGPKKPGKQQQQQQQQQHPQDPPPRFLLPDGNVNIPKVLDEQMDFIGKGGRADQFFAKYPGLQDLMARPPPPSSSRPSSGMSAPSSSTTTTPPPTVDRPTTTGTGTPVPVPALTIRDRDRAAARAAAEAATAAAKAAKAAARRRHRRPRVTEVDSAGNEIADDADDADELLLSQESSKAATAERTMPRRQSVFTSTAASRRRRGTTTTTTTTTSSPSSSFSSSPFPTSTTLLTPPRPRPYPPATRKRVGGSGGGSSTAATGGSGGGGGASGAAAKSSPRLDQKEGVDEGERRNVRWAPLPNDEGEGEGKGGVPSRQEEEEEQHHHQQQQVMPSSSSSSPSQRWSPGGTLRAGRAGRGRYGWR